MKRKEALKAKDLESINPIMLEEILGGALAAGDGTKQNTVIAQAPFSSFFHS